MAAAKASGVRLGCVLFSRLVGIYSARKNVFLLAGAVVCMGTDVVIISVDRVPTAIYIVFNGLREGSHK